MNRDGLSLHVRLYADVHPLDLEQEVVEVDSMGSKQSLSDAKLEIGDLLIVSTVEMIAQPHKKVSKVKDKAGLHVSLKVLWVLPHIVAQLIGE